MISVSNVSIHFTGTDLFSNVSFMINEKDRVGLVGKNGSGKTTLLRILSGDIDPQQGEAVIPSDIQIGFLPQEMKVDSGKTIREEASMAFQELINLETRISEYTDQLSHRTDYDSEEYKNIVTRLSESTERFQMLGGHTREADTERVLRGLGFTETDLERPVNEFSHGWRMRVELAKILLSRPHVVLLDEPTNHLDIESIQWVESYFRDYQGAIVLVSHDRSFLDNITQRTLEIDGGKVFDYKSNYSGYVSMREERLSSQIAAYNNQQKQIRQIERFIERFRAKNTKASQVQSKIKMLDKMEVIEPDERDSASIHFTFPPAPRSGKVVAEAAGLSKKYGNHTVLANLDFAIIKGDKVAFVGKNGEGKTTLSKILAGETAHSGNLKKGHNIITGYHAQELEGYLDPEKTVFETLDDIATGDIRKYVKSILGAFLFSGDAIDKKVKVLSGGEKSRLSLAKLMITPANFLILDEPTNHLDMISKDVLKNALLMYDGTLVVVSHDRDFLQGLTNKVFEFRNKKIREYLGDVYDFLESRKMEDLNDLEKQRGARTADNRGRSDRKAEWEYKKNFEKEKRKYEKRIREAEERISEIEKALKEKNEIMSRPDQFRDLMSSGEIYTEYEELRKKLEKEMSEWESLQLHLDKLLQEKPENS